jgi:hypothetical protein
MGFRCPERKGVADFLQEVSDPPEFFVLNLGTRNSIFDSVHCDITGYI